MENNQTVKKQRPFKEMIGDPRVTERFEKMLGDNATSFLMSVLNCVTNNDKLQKCDPESVLMASAVAGTLNLPVDPSLGMAYIIPYGDKAQFQIGYRGLIELGHRSQQFKGLNTTDVRQGEFKGIDRMTGRMEFDWIQDNDERSKLPVIGYVGYFELVNGFSKALYMTESEITKHASSYSKTYTHQNGRWNIDRPAMAKKTVLKLVLDKFAPKSVDMQTAIKSDQALIANDGSLNYIDNPNGQTIDLDELYSKQLSEIQDLLNIEGMIISEDEQLNIDRIIDQNEVESFKKVIVLLQSRKPKTESKTTNKKQ